jgi:hypothetical protein
MLTILPTHTLRPISVVLQEAPRHGACAGATCYSDTQVHHREDGIKRGSITPLIELSSDKVFSHR